MPIELVDRSRELLAQAYAELELQMEGFKKYEEFIYDYVQGTGNTSDKHLGLHLADALVRDHQDLKTKNAQLKELVTDAIVLLEESGNKAHPHVKALTEALEKIK
jgi:hypothetical protein